MLQSLHFARGQFPVLADQQPRGAAPTFVGMGGFRRGNPLWLPDGARDSGFGTPRGGCVPGIAGLQPGRLLQSLHFARGQFPVLADQQPRVGDRPEPHPAQPHHRVTNGLTHVPHLSGAPFVHDNRNHRLILSRAQRCFDQSHAGWRGPAAFDRHPSPQALEVRLVWHASDAGVILPFHLMTRMEQALSQRAVVGQQHQSLGVVVEPADRVDVFTHVRQQIEHRWSALRVLPRRHIPTRLVEQDVPVIGRDPDPLAVDADVIVPRVGFRAEFQNRLAVDADAALRDQHLGGAARRDTGGREDLLESFDAVFHHAPPNFVGADPRVGPTQIYCLSNAAKKSISFQTSRKSCCRSSSAWVIKPLSRTRTGVLP